MSNELIGIPNFSDSKVYVGERKDIFGNTVKRLILEGSAIVCDEPGINGRSYPIEIISREVAKLNRTKVSKGRLAGELNHPRIDSEANPKDYPIFEMNLSKTCALIEELRMDGKNLYCRMVVAEDTDAGRNLAGMIKIGYVPGYSLRGAGSTIPCGNYEEITNDYIMITVDVVGNPSFDDKALITSHYESTEGKRMPHKALVECINNYGREIVLNRNIDFRTDHYKRYNAGSLVNYFRSRG